MPLEPEAPGPIYGVAPSVQELEPVRWSGWKNVAARFGGLYFPLYFAFLSDTATPILGPFNDLAARRIWGIAEPVANEMTGSGDRLYDWLSVFWTFALSLIGATLWSLLDRRRADHRSVYEGMRVVIRYMVASIVTGYGFAKIHQFPALSYARMLQPLGAETPMGMLWNFMGASPGYTIFSGVLEVAGGTLLLFRRTTTLGALLTAAVMLNVFLLNVFYDVPVKQFSFHLFLAATVLLLPDLGRLLNVLVLNRPTVPRELTPPIQWPKLRVVVLVLKWLYFGQMLWDGAGTAREAWRDTHRPPSPLEGIWEVASFRRNGKEVETDSVRHPVRWTRIAIERAKTDSSRVTLVRGGDEGERGTLRFQGVDRLTLNTPDNGVSDWHYRLDGADHLDLESTVKGVATSVELTRATQQYPFTRARLHIVQEKPRTP